MSGGLPLRDWQAAEWWAGVSACCGLRRRAAALAAISGFFSRAWGRPAHLLNSGRSALALALSLLQQSRPQANEVIVPALACPALHQTLTRLGLKAVYADIGDDLNTPLATLQQVAGPATLAVIMVHAYGLPAAAADIAGWCRQQGIGLVDDAAQILAPETGLGGFGDFGIFSFAQSKCVVSGIGGSGGVLLVNQDRHVEAAARLCAGRSAAAPGRRRAWAEFALDPLLPRAAGLLSRLRPPAPTEPLAISTLDAAIVGAQLDSLAQRRTRRKILLQRWSEQLAERGREAPQLGAALAGTAWLSRLLVRFPAGQRDARRAAMSQAGWPTRLPYPLPADLPPGLCPNAERAAAELLELPMNVLLYRMDSRTLHSLLQ